MTDEERQDEGVEETIVDLEAPETSWEDVVGGMPCQLPTKVCSDPTCTGQTYCKPGTKQNCAKPTCQVTAVWVQ